MAVAYISEYADIRANAALEPFTASQTVAIGAEAKSSAFAATTHFIRIHVDAICSIKFGAAPTASANNKRLATNQTEYFKVQPGHKVSVITNT
jgi:hypothetical protein